MRHRTLTTILLGSMLGCAHSAKPMFSPEQDHVMDFPSDANGDVLRRMAASGDDLTQARIIEFVHVMPREAAARQMAASAQRLGFTVSVDQLDDDDGRMTSDWEVTCSLEMVPSHARITETEMRLGKLAKSFGGYADGWGCFH